MKVRAPIFKAAALLMLAVAAAAVLYVHARAARLVSEGLSRKLGLPASVSLVEAGASSGITLYSVRIDCPDGAGTRRFIEIPAINIRPDYKELMHGRIAIDGISVARPKVFLSKNSDGSWNAVAALDAYRAANPKKDKPLPEFFIGSIRIDSGNIEVDGLGAPVEIASLGLDGITNRPGERTAVEADIRYSRIVRLDLSGDMDLFSGSPSANGEITLRVMGLGGRIKAPGIKADKAYIDLNADISYKDANVRCAFDASVGELKTSDGTELPIRLTARAGYDMHTDSVTIEDAGLSVADMPKVVASGNITGVKSNMVGDFILIMPEFDLKVVKPYLPKGVGLSGRASITEAYIRGPLRPFGAEAGARLGFTQLSASYGGRGFSGGFGGTSLKFASGRLSGRYDFRLLGGGITGGLGNYRGQSRFSLSAKGIELSMLDGPGEGFAGTLGAELEGTVSPGGRITAEYAVSAAVLNYPKAGISAGTVTAKGKAVRDNKMFSATAQLVAEGISLPEKKLSVGRVELDGEAALAKGGPAASGRLAVTGIDGMGRHEGGFSTDWGYDGGRLLVKAATYRDKELSVSAGGIEAVPGGQAKEIKAWDVTISFRDGLMRVDGAAMDAKYSPGPDGGVGAVKCLLTTEGGEVYGLALSGARFELSGEGGKYGAKAGLSVSGNPIKIEAEAEVAEGVLKKHRLSGTLDVKDLKTLGPAFERLGLSASPDGGSLEASFSARGEGMRIDAGGGKVKLAGLSVSSKDRPLASGLSVVLAPSYGDGRLTLPRTRLDFGGYFGLDLSAEAARGEDGWTGTAGIELAPTPLGKVQEGVIEALPPKLMWADMSGEVSAAFTARYLGRNGLRLDGSLELDGAKLGLPDSGLYIGPAYGRIPVGLSFGKPKEVSAGAKAAAPPVFRGESFDRASYPGIVRSYSKVPDDADLVIDSIRFGFVDLEAVTLALTPGEGWYDIDWLGLSTFRGNLYGYGRVDLSGGPHALSLIMSDFSLTELCDTVPPIKGYLSGRVDGLMRLVAKGKGYEGVTGAATFWAEDGEGDEREISKEFIKKLMGSSLKKYMAPFIGDRYFDTGELDIVFSKGDLVFDKLLIENTNFLGSRDLYITVAPVSNRITIEHLLEVIKDVGSRAKGM